MPQCKPGGRSHHDHALQPAVEAHFWQHWSIPPVMKLPGPALLYATPTCTLPQFEYVEFGVGGGGGEGERDCGRDAGGKGGGAGAIPVTFTTHTGDVGASRFHPCGGTATPPCTTAAVVGSVPALGPGPMYLECDGVSTFGCMLTSVRAVGRRLGGGIDGCTYCWGVGWMHLLLKVTVPE